MAAHRDPPLTIDEILSVATALTAEHGLEAVTMRLLAGTLAVTPMAVYHHVPDRATLCDLVADRVVAAARPPSGRCSWQTWLRRYHRALWIELRRHRGVAAHLLGRTSTPAGAAIRRQTVEMFATAGFAHRDALLAASTFHTHLLGRMVVDADPERTIGVGDPAWSEDGLTAEAYAEHGLATVIAGLEVLHARSGVSRSARHPMPQRR
jgi:AcrR family transcriptional regulator